MYLTPRDALYASIATCTWPDISPFARTPLDPDLFDPGLHWWQFELLEKVAALYRAGYRRVLLQLATGGGKTVIALSALLSARRQGLTAAFLVHRKELLRQTGKRFTSSALDHSFVAAKFPFDPAAGLHLIGVQTMINRLGSILPPMLVIVDEAHHAVSSTYEQILEQWPDAFILLLTATPERLDGRGLGEQADVMVRGPSPRWLMDNGYLSDFDAYSISIPDFSKCPSVAGDFNKRAAAEIMNKPGIVGSVVEHYIDLAYGVQGIVFGQNVEHSKMIADAFNGESVGGKRIRAMHVDADTSQTDRDWFDEAFRAGEIDIATNCDLFAEGYDVPNIGYLGDAGRSKSHTKVKQRHGRVLRFAPDKRGIIADHAGNIMPTQFGGQGHGLPDEDYDYTLDGATGRADAAEKDWTSITQCTGCFLIYPSGTPACPRCKENKPMAPRIIRQVEGKLTKVEREALQKANTARRQAEEHACTTYEEVLSLAKARGYAGSIGWAKKFCKRRRIALPWERRPAIENVPDDEWDGGDRIPADEWEG